METAVVRVLSDEELLCLERSGNFGQYYHMRYGFEHGLCSFCSVNTDKNTILHENDYWMVWENIYPNERHCSVMLVIVLKPHTRSLAHMNVKQWVCFEEAILWISKRYKLPGGALVMRFGDMQFNAGTVPHLHFNLWVPDGTGEVRIPIFKDDANREKNRARAAAFAVRYEAGEVPD